VPHGTIDAHGPNPMGAFARAGDFTPFTPIWNVTGQPAISLPAGVGEDGLPTNAHLVGKPLGEDTLLQVANQLETARSAG
jgi:amidase